MFFSKIAFPLIALVGFFTVAFATPIANKELVARNPSTDAVAGITAVVDAIVAASAEVVADVKVDAFVSILVASTKSYNALPVGVVADVDLDVYVAAIVDVIVKIFAVIKVFPILDLTAFAQIDVALSAFITAVAKAHVSVAVLVGKGIPAVDLNIFVTLKLVLTATVLGLVDILGIINL